MYTKLKLNSKSINNKYASYNEKNENKRVNLIKIPVDQIYFTNTNTFKFELDRFKDHRYCKDKMTEYQKINSQPSHRYPYLSKGYDFDKFIKPQLKIKSDVKNGRVAKYFP